MKSFKFKSCEEFIKNLLPGDFITLTNENVLFVYMGNYKKIKKGYLLYIFRMKCCYDDSLTFDWWSVYNNDIYKTVRIMRNK